MEDPEAIDYTIEDLKTLVAAELVKKELRNDNAYIPIPGYFDGFPATDRDVTGYKFFQKALCLIDCKPVVSDKIYIGGKLGEALAAMYPAE